MINTDEKAIAELLSRGVEEVIDREDLVKMLRSGKQLRVKLGTDPTSPNLHLGRAIQILKLKDFQDLLPNRERDEQGRGDKIGEPARLIEIERIGIRLFRQVVV